MYKPFVFRLSSFVFVPVPLPVPALVFVLLLLLLFLLTHDVCVGWGVLFVVVLLFLCVVCCAGSVSVCFLFVPSSLMRPCDLVILLFCCALSVCNVCVLSLPVVLPVGLLFAMSCFFVLALVCWFLCLCVYNVELTRRCVSSSLCFVVYVSSCVYADICVCMECFCVYVYMYVHVNQSVYLYGQSSFLILWAGDACPFVVDGVKLSG